MDRNTNIIVDLNGNKVVLIKDIIFKGKKSINWDDVFHASMLVRHANDGKMYLYDMIDIKKETSNLFRS